MNKQQQTVLVTELVNVMREGILFKITMDRVPESWDGIELRQYIADYAKEYIAYLPMDKKRMREYRNALLVNNL